MSEFCIGLRIFYCYVIFVFSILNYLNECWSFEGVDWLNKYKLNTILINKSSKTLKVHTECHFSINGIYNMKLRDNNLTLYVSHQWDFSLGYSYNNGDYQTSHRILFLLTMFFTSRFKYELYKGILSIVQENITAVLVQWPRGNTTLDRKGSAKMVLPINIWKMRSVGLGQNCFFATDHLRTPQTSIERVLLRTEIVEFNLHDNSDYTYLFRPDMSVNLYIFHRHPLNKAITNERKWEHFAIPKSTHWAKSYKNYKSLVSTLYYMKWGLEKIRV